MTSGLRALTPRGRSFLASGVAAFLCAFLLGEHDLLRVGVLILSLPLLAAMTVSRTRYRLSCARRLDPPRSPVGGEAVVTLRLENVTRLPTGLLMIEDIVPHALGARPRFVLDRVEAHGVREIDYRVGSDMRGRYSIGPLTVRIGDPFGLVELTRSFSVGDTLVVTPRVVALPRVRLSGERAGGGESRTRSMAAAGDDDVAPREYRYGDDLRRVHWRSTARHGELMVRREEQQWQSRGALLLDTRRHAHRGEGPRSSFETAVSAAASIGVHLAREGLGLRLVTDQGAEPLTGPDLPLPDALAVVTTSATRSLEYGLAALRQGGGDGLIVAVLGAVDAEQARALARLRHGTATGVAVMLDVATWERPADAPGEEWRAARAVLAGAGWRVVRLPSDTSIASVWPEAAGQERFTFSGGGS
ncbi:membrane protein [Streptosporangium violaceochromogenes]|nr:membrane protein [Streptosporangium violaceochromogenes]